MLVPFLLTRTPTSELIFLICFIQYTDEERQILNSYQSLEYLPPHSKVYRNWLQQQPARLDWDRWLMMGLIGFSVGILGFLLHQIIDLISEVKWEQTQEYIQVCCVWRMVALQAR